MLSVSSWTHWVSLFPVSGLLQSCRKSLVLFMSLAQRWRFNILRGTLNRSCTASPPLTRQLWEASRTLRGPRWIRLSLLIEAASIIYTCIALSHSCQSSFFLEAFSKWTNFIHMRRNQVLFLGNPNKDKYGCYPPLCWKQAQEGKICCLRSYRWTSERLGWDSVWLHSPFSQLQLHTE